MLKKIPDFVMAWLKNEAKQKNSIKIDIDTFNDEQMTHRQSRYGLSFSWDLKFYGLNGYTLDIEDYLLQHINYGRGFFKIYANRTGLDEIEQPRLTPPEFPPQIDLSQTSQD